MAQVNTQYLAIMQLDSIELEKRRHEQTPEGKLIRKEITRRNKCGYWKGEFPVHKGGIDGTMQTPSVVGTVRIVGGTSAR
tara:strand:+ start:2192 stop:2431 length:240 start_codon:yes stop_codon:yes gene_type:complete